MSRGDLCVLSAPSGAGKTTLIQSLLRGTFGISSLRFSVSHTTRPSRSVEIEGQDRPACVAECVMRLYF